MTSFIWGFLKKKPDLKFFNIASIQGQTTAL